jgi:hypothetical protein
MTIKFWLENLKVWDIFGDTDNTDHKSGIWGYRLGSCGSGHGPVVVSCKTQPSGIINTENLFTSQVTLDSAPWSYLYCSWNKPAISKRPPRQYPRKMMGQHHFLLEIYFWFQFGTKKRRIPSSLQLLCIHKFRSSVIWGIHGKMKTEKTYNPWNFTLDNTASLPNWRI